MVTDMNTITFIISCSLNHSDGSKELFTYGNLTICLLYCNLYSFFSRFKLRFLNFNALKNSDAHPPQFSFFGRKFTCDEGKDLSLFHLGEIASILTDKINSKPLIYIDDTRQLKFCDQLFYKKDSFSIVTPAQYSDKANEYIISHYGAAGIVKYNISYKNKTIISLANDHHNDFNDADYIICLGDAVHTGSIDLECIIFTPPSSLSFLPPSLCSAPYLEKIMNIAGINFENAKIKFIKYNK